MAVDRLADDYEPDFATDLSVHERARALVAAIQAGDVEVVADEKAATTGNFYVEVSCLGRPSRFATTKAQFWAMVVSGKVVVIVDVPTLREAVARAQLEGREVRMGRGSHPTTGVLIPVRELVHRCVSATDVDQLRLGV